MKTKDGTEQRNRNKTYYDSRRSARKWRVKVNENCSLELASFHYYPIKEYSKHQSVVSRKMRKYADTVAQRNLQARLKACAVWMAKSDIQHYKSCHKNYSFIWPERHQNQKHLLQNIHRCNTCFRMTSFRGTFVEDENTFSLVFRIKEKPSGFAIANTKWNNKISTSVFYQWWTTWSRPVLQQYPRTKTRNCPEFTVFTA